MFTTFEGQTRSRPSINLGGGAGGSSSSSSAARAREERLQRESNRRLDKSARVIQGWWRSRRIASTVREELRRQWDALPPYALGANQASSSGSVASGMGNVIASTAMLAFFFQEENKSDISRLAKWTRSMATPASPGSNRIMLFQSMQEAAHELPRWSILLRRMAVVLVRQAALHPKLPSIPLFLEVVRQLLDPAKYKELQIGLQPDFTTIFLSIVAETLVRHGLYTHLRTHILAFRTNLKPAQVSLSPVIAIALSTLSRLRAAASVQYAEALSAFCQKLVTVEGLCSTARLSATSVASLVSPASQLPYFDLLASVAYDGYLDTISEQDGPNTIANLLGNLLSIGKARISPSATPAPSNKAAGTPTGSIASGKDLIVLLDAYQACLGRIPVALLITGSSASSSAGSKGKTRETAIEIPELDDTGDVHMSDASAPSPVVLHPSTIASLSALISEAFLSSLIALSTRYSASSRPALSSFLVTLLYTWTSQREKIVNTLVYSGLVGAGKGLLREIWRGWIRTSLLARTISSADSKTGTSATSAVINALMDRKYEKEWPHFVLLSELYSRCLLTLGDDEFFSASTATGQDIGVNSRNPLMLDEVIAFSGLLRNVAFTLYWQPDLLVRAAGEENLVVGTRVSLESLRKLSTGLLQMIHARDSRRRFTPPSHWLMTSQLDLQSFIETAILEDQAIDNDELSHSDTRRGRPGAGPDEDSDDEMPTSQANVRKNLPTRRQMAFLSPRLGVLNNIPFVIPFETRASIFQQFIANDRARLGLSSHRNRGFDGRRVAAAATIRRGHVANDGFATLNNLGSQLKERLAIRFIDQYGQEEAGIDGGGLFKEFLTSLSKEAFDINRGLWLENTRREIFPAPTSYAREPFSLQWYAFLGRILGKALYESVLVDVPFAPFFLSKWLGRASGFDDLASFDPDLYHGLVQLKNHVGDVEKDLSLTFAVTDDDFGVSRTIELIPSGSNIPVTNENRISYIYRVSDYRLNKQVERQCSAFFSGLSDLIDPKWLRMFNQVELGLLVGGAETAIDIEDLRHNTVYTRGFDESHPSIQYFWKVVDEFSQNDKKALIKFATSCPRPPLLGFSQLNPKFAIGNGGSDETRLPSASTCVNLLKLPAYSDPETLRQKLRASINSGAGFDLS